MTDGEAAAGEVLDLVARLAELLVAGSYEGTPRVEGRLKAVASAYGAHAEVAVSAESAVVSVEGKTRVVSHAPEIPPLAQVSALKPWFAQVTTGRMPLRQARAMLEAIAESPPVYPSWLRLVGFVLFSVGFGVSIQPTWQQAAITAPLGLAVGLIQVGLQHLRRPGWLAPLCASAVVGGVVLTASSQGWVHGGTIALMVPALFVFIPGDAITMSMIELSTGRYTAGAARFAQSLAALATLAFGPVLAAAALGIDQKEIFDQAVPPTLGPVAGWLGWAVFAVGVMLVFGMRTGDLPWAMTMALGTYGLQLLTVRAFDSLTGTFLAAAAMATASLLLGRYPRTPPPYVLYLTAFFVLTPGSHGLRGLDAWIGGHPIQGMHDVTQMLALLTAIALGMLTAACLVPALHPADQGPTGQPRTTGPVHDTRTS